MTGESPQPDDDLLRSAFEQRLARGEDPLGALSDLLSGRSADGATLGMHGEVLAGYRLLAVLGTGGMGVTWAGVDDQGRRAAVKVVSGLRGNAGERFAAECRILQALSHPGVVRYRGHGVLDDGRGYLIMDLVNGTDLEVVSSDVLQPEPQTAAAKRLLEGIELRGEAVLAHPAYRRRMLRLLAAVADALEYAHQAGIVHRDLKPANVLVTGDLDPVLIDFGLSRDLLQKVSLTRSGATLGTFAYMAPEQMGRDPGRVSARSDVFALGLLVYRVLAGRDLREEMADVIGKAHRPFLLDAKTSRVLPVDLQAILYRCLDARPGHRYPTAAALADDLRAAAGNGLVSARRPGFLVRHLRSPWGLVSRVGALVATAVAAVVWAWPTEAHWVQLASLENTTEVSVAGGPWMSATGRIRLPVPLPADIEVAVRVGGPDHRVLHKTCATTPGEPLEWWAFPSAGMPVHPIDFPIGVTNDPPGCILQVLTPTALTAADRTIGDQQLPKGTTWVRLPANTKQSIAATHGGIHEEQTITTPADGEIADIVLCPHDLLTVPGKLRVTWATVFSPLPEAPGIKLIVHRQNTASFLGASTQRCTIEDRTITAPSCYTLAAAGKALTTVTAEFDETVHSMVVLFRSGTLAAKDSLRLSYQLDDAMEQPVPEHEPLWVSGSWGKQPRATLLEIRSAKGFRTFSLIARMQDSVEPGRENCKVQHLAAPVAGPFIEDEAPCFAIAADPTDVTSIEGMAPLTEEARAVPLGMLERLEDRHWPWQLLWTGEPGTELFGPITPLGAGRRSMLLRIRRGENTVETNVGLVDLGSQGKPMTMRTLDGSSRSRGFGTSTLVVPTDTGEPILVGDPNLDWPNGAAATSRGPGGGVFLVDGRTLQQVGEPWRLSGFQTESVIADSHFGGNMTPLGDMFRDGSSVVAISAGDHPGGVKWGLVQLRRVGPDATSACTELIGTPKNCLHTVPQLATQGDADRDGIADLVTARYKTDEIHTSLLEVWSGSQLAQLSPGQVSVDTLHPMARHEFAECRSVSSAMWADFDADGKDDLLICRFPLISVGDKGHVGKLTAWSPSRDLVLWQKSLAVPAALKTDYVHHLAVTCTCLLNDIDGDGVKDVAVLCHSHLPAAQPDAGWVAFLSGKDGNWLGCVLLPPHSDLPWMTCFSVSGGGRELVLVLPEGQGANRVSSIWSLLH